MLRVWTDSQPSGHLDRHGARGTTFVYDPKAAATRAVSVTMPVRTASWDTAHGLAPIFDMNLPEGALRAHLTRGFAKATGSFDDFDLLGVVGRTQIGRIRYSDPEAELTEDVPFQSIDEILRARRGGELFDYLLNTFAIHSGLSGIQPKVMIRATADDRAIPSDRQSRSFRTATHIVKFWEAEEFPELAANEYFCLSAAKALKLTVPDFQLSDNGLAVVIARFDLKPDGSYLGYEDFCVLNGLPSVDKYKGGYETRLFRRAREFIGVGHRARAFEDLFKLFVLNCAIRNGDAHLKNFGAIYDDVTGPARLAPVYDLVSTLPYLPKDAMALTLDGSTNWPEPKALIRLGQTRCDLSLPAIKAIIEEIADVLAGIAPDIKRYFRGTATHRDVGARLLDAWKTGIRDSLGVAGRILTPLSVSKSFGKAETHRRGRQR
jgi:serine/threonine-protein kinase HipA